MTLDRRGLTKWGCSGGLNIPGKETSYRDDGFIPAPLYKGQQNRNKQQKRHTGNDLLAWSPHGILFRFQEIAGRVIVLQGDLLRGVMPVHIGRDKKSTAEHKAGDQRCNHADGDFFLHASRITLQGGFVNFAAGTIP